MNAHLQNRIRCFPHLDIDHSDLNYAAVTQEFKHQFRTRTEDDYETASDLIKSITPTAAAAVNKGQTDGEIYEKEKDKPRGIIILHIIHSH
jgi:hypothetical protein